MLPAPTMPMRSKLCAALRDIVNDLREAAETMYIVDVVASISVVNDEVERWKAEV
jgi:aspartate aminotransferase-like enzyme